MTDDLDYFIVDPGATVHIFYAANPGNGEEARVETLGGTINGVYKRSAAIRIMDCEGVCTRLSFERAILSSSVNKPTGRSISGLFILLGRTVIDWQCKHQPYTTLHSGEAETLACATGASHLMYWIQLIEQMFGSQPTAEALTDSTTARQFLTNPLHTSQMRHIRIRLFFVRELVNAGFFRILHIPGVDNPADLLTKPLSRADIDKLLQLLIAWGGGKPSVDTQRATLGKRKRDDDGDGSHTRVRLR